MDAPDAVADDAAERPPKRAAVARESVSPSTPVDVRAAVAREGAFSPYTFYNIFGDMGADMRLLFGPNVTHAIVGTMALDLLWALGHFPQLLTMESVFVASSPPRDVPMTSFPPNMRHAEPRCGVYGVPHGKFFCLIEPDRITVIITTANLVSTDFTSRANAFWAQTFALRAADAPVHDRIGYTRARNDFGPVLLDYLRRLDTPADMLARVARYDYSGAAVALVASCPGEHRKADRFNFGQLRLKRVLDVEGSVGQGPALANVSSLGRLDKPFAASLAANLGAATLEVIWPSVEAVRDGRGGYEDGLHICCNQANAARASSLLKHQYRARGPEPVSPHFKSFFRFAPTADAPRALQYFLLTSHNLSKSAWGSASAHELSVASFELGVLFLPQLLSRVAQRDVPLGFAYNGEDGAMPVPFRWPAAPYAGSTAVPWTWDTEHLQPDRFGFVYTGDKQLVPTFDV